MTTKKLRNMYDTEDILPRANLGKINQKIAFRNFFWHITGNRYIRQCNYFTSTANLFFVYNNTAYCGQKGAKLHVGSIGYNVAFRTGLKNKEDFRSKTKKIENMLRLDGYTIIDSDYDYEIPDTSKSS